MKILTISGSARMEGSNQQLLQRIPLLIPDHDFVFFDITTLPLFTDKEAPINYPKEVVIWKTLLENANALLICTPEYVHNIPAALKNAIEWVYASGELAHKKVLPIVYTPKAPRGEKAMQSLINSLSALEANVVVNLLLHHDEDVESFEMLQEALNILTT